MSRAVATGRRTGGDSGDDDSVRTFAEVNLDAKDGDQAIERHEDQPLTVDQDGDGERPQERDWLDRNKAARKRMARLTRSFDQRMAETEARHQREMRDLRAKVESVGSRKEASTGPNEAQHESKMAELQAKLEKAMELGESKQAAAITREMQQTEAKYWSEKRAAISPTTETRSTTAARTEEPVVKDTGLPKVAKRWINAQDWWDDPDFKVERQAAVIFDEELMADGSNPAKKSHYRKLARSLKNKFPDLDVEMPWKVDGEEASAEPNDDDEDDDDVVNTRPVRQEKEVRNARPSVPGFGDRGQIPSTQRRVAAGGRKVMLSQEDRAAMARFKMDPDNDADVANWARSKEETDRAYTGRG